MRYARGVLVENFVGAPVMVDAAGLCAASHRVRLFWQNFQSSEILYATLPSDLPHSPPLNLILHLHHVPTKSGHSDRHPISPQNQMGGERRVLQTIISYLGSNAFTFRDNGKPGEGMVCTTRTTSWEGPDVAEKACLMAYRAGKIETPGVTPDHRSLLLGEAMEGNTMRWLGAFLKGQPCVGLTTHPGGSRR